MENEFVTVVAVFDHRVFYSYMDTVGVGYVTGHDQARTEYDIEMVYVVSGGCERSSCFLPKVSKEKLLYLGRCAKNEVRDRAVWMLFDKLEKANNSINHMKGTAEACAREFNPDF